jgi:hypothetical protein
MAILRKTTTLVKSILLCIALLPMFIINCRDCDRFPSTSSTYNIMSGKKLFFILGLGFDL